MRRTCLFFLFFLSGFSALVYELVWQRLLNLVFGVSTLSVSAVVAAFMAGVALGGLLFGRWVDRTNRPLRLYALLETGIGAMALLVPPLFTVLTAGYNALYTHWPPGQWGGACVRFGMALVVLVPPATLIGGTVPVMGRLALRRDSSLAATFSLFYAVNTLGAVCGAALTGFVLLRLTGMQHSLCVAAGLNFLVAGVAGLVLRDQGVRSQESGVRNQESGIRSQETGEAEAVNARLPGPHFLLPALVCAAVTGATSMGFEVAWMRILGILTSNSAYGFALLLTVLLLGLGLGSLVQAWWLRRRGDDWRRLAVCQVLLAVVTLATLPCFRTSPDWLARLFAEGTAATIFLGELALTAEALFLPALLTGMSFPLLVAAAAREPARIGRRLGTVYAANTLGCVAGPFLVGFVLIPRVGIQATMEVMIGGSMVVGFVALALSSGPTPIRKAVLGAGLGLAAAAGWFFVPAGAYHKSLVREPRHLLFYGEGNNATVSVVEEEDRTRSIMVDGQPVAITCPTNVVDQKMLAHLPLLLHPGPHRALTVGFGSGGTSHSMTLHGIDVDCVEIEGRVPAAAEFFRAQNHDVLRHARFHLVLDDARSWLRVAPVRYDVIVTDCTNIQYRSNGDLYTVDYFRLMQKRLAAGGLAAAWVPANGIRDVDLKTLLRSFQAVFPHTSVWFMNTLPTDFLIVVGTPGPLDIDLGSLEKRIQQPGIVQDLAAIGLADPCRLVYTFLASDDELRTYLGAGPLNTDDRPVLSYSTYGAALRPTFPTNLLHLLACRGDVARYVRHPAAPDRMLRHYAASNEAMLGHIAYLVDARPAAALHYLKGIQFLPDDPALNELVRGTYADWK